MRFLAGIMVLLQAAGATASARQPASAMSQDVARPLYGAKEAAETKSVYHVAWAPAVTLTASTLLFWGIMESVVVPTLASTKTCQRTPQGFCDASRLPGIDHASLGRRNRGWERATNVGLVVLPAAALAGVALDAWLAGGTNAQRLKTAGTEMFVTAESAAVAVLLTSGLKLAVRRPRPRQYSLAASSSVESDLSFPSGHTSLVAASLAAAATTATLRHTQWRYRLPIWVMAAAATATMGIGRVAAGWHFPSDVMGGAILGAACGIVVPLLQVAPVILEPSFAAQGALSLSATWAL